MSLDGAAIHRDLCADFQYNGGAGLSWDVSARQIPELRDLPAGDF
tara:strand:- start:445 stop:579 length:135 start_codon:yes stop_codon:yes gene_type:complete